MLKTIPDKYVADVYLQVAFNPERSDTVTVSISDKAICQISSVAWRALCHELLLTEYLDHKRTTTE